MKKIFMLLVAFAAVFFTSCSKDDETEPINSGGGVITMTTDRWGYTYFQIKTAKAGDVVIIDWGDGNIEELRNIKEEEDGDVWYYINAEHTYSQRRTHTIKVTGAMTWLSCFNNQLTSLDASKCTTLEFLDCRENQLTSLDVSKCTALTRLLCFRNRLTSLNISKCTVLKDLDCGENQLTSLDVSKCTILEGLKCVYNPLSTNALNKIFTDLPQGKTWQENDYTWQSEIYIEGNPGTATCNKSIAENKGWKIEQGLGH